MVIYKGGFMKKIICAVVMFICLYISVHTMFDLGYDTDTWEFWKVYLSLIICSCVARIYQDKDI